jgi:hypothetical protein
LYFELLMLDAHSPGGLTAVPHPVQAQWTPTEPLFQSSKRAAAKRQQGTQAAASAATSAEAADHDEYVVAE